MRSVFLYFLYIYRYTDIKAIHRNTVFHQNVGSIISSLHMYLRKLLRVTPEGSQYNRADLYHNKALKSANTVFILLRYTAYGPVECNFPIRYLNRNIVEEFGECLDYLIQHCLVFSNDGIDCVRKRVHFS